MKILARAQYAYAFVPDVVMAIYVAGDTFRLHNHIGKIRHFLQRMVRTKKDRTVVTGKILLEPCNLSLIDFTADSRLLLLLQQLLLQP